eukprot:15475534-Alexandrium_andersonii.AAC.1
MQHRVQLVHAGGSAAAHHDRDARLQDQQRLETGKSVCSANPVHVVDEVARLVGELAKEGGILPARQQRVDWQHRGSCVQPLPPSDRRCVNGEVADEVPAGEDGGQVLASGKHPTGVQCQPVPVDGGCGRYVVGGGHLDEVLRYVWR